MKTTTQKQNAPTQLLTQKRREEPTHLAIAQCAYALWEQQGHPQNQEIANWLQAESDLRHTLHPQAARN